MAYSVLAFRLLIEYNNKCDGTWSGDKNRKHRGSDCAPGEDVAFANFLEWNEKVVLGGSKCSLVCLEPCMLEG